MTRHRAIAISLAIGELCCLAIFVLAVLLYAALVVRADEVVTCVGILTSNGVCSALCRAIQRHSHDLDLGLH
jgi:hypothetical protein